MEPEAIQPDRLMLGVFVLTAIPIVLFAIWSQYFQGYLEEQAANEPDFEKANETFRVRFASLFALIAQFMIFLGSTPVRRSYPVAGNLIFVGALLLQMWMQSSLERKLSPTAAKPSDYIGVAARAFFWSLMSGALYIVTLGVSLKVFTMIAQAIQAPPGVGMAFTAMGAIVGVLAGLGLGFALGPVQLRKMFPVEPLKNERLIEEFTRSFGEAGLRAPSYWVIRSERFPMGNALISGFQNGRGIFRPGLFISQSILDSMTPEELRAIVLHEISHLKLRHLKQRFLLSAGLILATSFFAGIVSFGVYVLIPNGPLNPFFGLAALVGAFWGTFRMLGQQNRLQEVEADLEALKLGARWEDLASALRKLDTMNRQPSDQENPEAKLTGSGHPATEERIQIMEAWTIAREANLAAAKEDEDAAPAAEKIDRAA